MTLEEAIIHSREVARDKSSEGCIECAKEHEQLAEWLEELKIYKKALELACSADGMFWESEYNEYLQEARKSNEDEQKRSKEV